MDADEVAQLANQLDTLGLELREITADGNCMFRAVSDQMVGTDDNYRKLRQNTCLYIMKNKAHFLPFIGESDDEFKRFIKYLNTDGVFGGHEALVAMSRENNVMIGIHQVGEPVWYSEWFP